MHVNLELFYHWYCKWPFSPPGSFDSAWLISFYSSFLISLDFAAPNIYYGCQELRSSCSSLPSCRVRCVLVLSGFSHIFVKPRSKLNTETCYWCGSCWPTTCSVAGYVLMFFRQDLKHRRRSVDFYDVESVCVKAAFEWGHVVVVGVFFVNTALRLECDVERRRYDVVSDCVFCTKKTYELSNAGNSRLNANTLSHILWSFYFSRSKYYATLISTKRLECAESKLNKATVDS